MGFVPACFEVVLYIRKEVIQSGGFDGLKCLTVDPGRTTIPLGYPPLAYEPLRAKGLNYDFYLTHDIKHKEYSKEWRLYYPKEIRASQSAIFPPRA
jgi:hypothetical protein